MVVGLSVRDRPQVVVRWHSIALHGGTPPSPPPTTTTTTGQELVVLVMNDGGWWEGEANGQTGLFPSSYVKLQQ